MTKPTYVFSAWHETTLWVAAVDDVLHGGSEAALYSATQARGYGGIEAMARDLIATLLDLDEDTFEVQVRYNPKPPADFACQCPCAGCKRDCRLHLRGTNRRSRRTGLIIKNTVDKREPGKDEEKPRRKISTTGYFGRAPRKIARLARYHDGLAGNEAHGMPVPRPKVGGARHTRTARRA